MISHAVLMLLIAACPGPRTPQIERAQAVSAALIDSLVAHDAERVVLQAVYADPLPQLRDDPSVGVADSSRRAVARRVLVRYGIEPRLAEDFVAVNGVADSVCGLPPARVRVDFDTLGPLSAAERDSARRADRHETHAERVMRAYPGARGELALSHVGFSADGEEALVYYETRCGSLCGRGALVRLQRVAGQWHVVARVTLWVS